MRKCRHALFFVAFFFFFKRMDIKEVLSKLGFPGGSGGKESASNARDPG